MEARTAALILLSLIVTCITFIIAYLTPSNFSQPLIGIPIIGLVPIFFFFGVLGFGFLSIIPGIFLGFQLGLEKNAILFIYLIPLTIALYSGIKLGTILWKDFKQETYFLKEIQPVITSFIIAMIFALAIHFVIPYIIELQLFQGSELIVENTGSLNNLFEGLRGIKVR